MSKRKTRQNEKNYNYFKERFLYYVDRYNQKDWIIYFNLDKGESDSWATTSWDIANSTVHVRFFEKCDWNDKVLDDTARHEVIHIIVAPLHSLAMRRYLMEFDLDKEVERLTVLLEKLLT